ncbi:MAG: nucleoside hydrolase [Planctomycetes bacterium]|nr:nucleoside hydrolase [Planctomycetota bacterium]
MAGQTIPVVLDTDIGGDIDDTWALGFLLRCPELDLKLVTTAVGDTEYRTRIVAKFLGLTGRSDVPVGVGIQTPFRKDDQPQGPWVADYRLASYPGRVHSDGVKAMIDFIMSSPRPVTLIAIGPLTNVAEAIRREPRIVGKTRFVGMHGCLKRSQMGKSEVVSEYNVKVDIPACRKAFAAGWEKLVTPLDTCGIVRLTGAKYDKVAKSKDVIASNIIENYKIWRQSGCGKEWTGGSSILYDCVAVYMAYCLDLLVMEKMGVTVTDGGLTVADLAGPRVNMAVDWRDLPAFEDLLVQRLTRP